MVERLFGLIVLIGAYFCGEYAWYLGHAVGIINSNDLTRKLAGTDSTLVFIAVVLFTLILIILGLKMVFHKSK